MLEHFKLVAGEGGLEAVGETDEECPPRHGGCPGDDGDGAARMDEGVVRPADLDPGNDLGAG